MLGFAVVGCGRVAPRHANALLNIPEAKLIAFADIIWERANNLANLYGGIPYTDYRYILDRKDVDVLCICTPSNLHTQIAIEALQAGKHVLIEKPVALSMPDANRLLSISTQTKLKVGVAYQYRFMPLIQDLNYAVRNGLLGHLLIGNSTVRWYRPPEYYADGWHGTKEYEGGTFMNQIIHFVDLMQWIMGDVKSVFAYTATLMHDIETEDAGIVVMRFKNKAMGSIEGSTIVYPKGFEGSLTVVGTRGSVKIGGAHLDQREVWTVENFKNKGFIPINQEMQPHTFHQYLLEDMISSIYKDREPLINCLEAMKSVRVVQAIYESAKTGHEINLANQSDLGKV